jgi:hypothetical protein
MSDNSSSGGMGCLGWLSVLLTVLFVGLKLTNYIAWSWVWVFSPIWISIVLICIFFLILIAINKYG